MERKRLSNRRGHELVDFRHGSFNYVAGIGRFDDGSLAEVFLNAAKTGTPIDAAARDAAITLSLALQHGVPPETVRHALTRNADGTASGPIGALLDMLAHD
jgi:ribonucleoside-diphosphate reductase alpha chain